MGCYLTPGGLRRLENRINKPNDSWTEAEMADEAKITRNTIRTIRQKPRKPVKENSLRKLFLALELTLEDSDYHCGQQEEQGDERITVSPDSYLYYIQEAVTADRVPTRFLPLMVSDINEIMSNAWRGIFTDVWERILQEETLRVTARKLICDESDDQRIQGLLFLGTGQDAYWTLDCLLETAPFNRYDRSARSFRGVGSALMARLVAEHTQRGFRLPLLLETSPRAMPFYKHLGCIVPPASAKPNRLILPQEAAKRLFAQVTDRALSED